jgi:hypothetical protein
MGVVAIIGQKICKRKTRWLPIKDFSLSHKIFLKLKRALKDSNPRHLVLETNVLPTELRTQGQRLQSISAGSSDRDLFVSIEALFDTSGLAHPIAKIEKLSSSDLTTSYYCDGVYLGRMQQEDPLYTYTLENSTNGNGFIDTTMPSGDDNPFIGLNPFLVAFFDFDTNFNGVTNVKLGQVTFEVLCLDRANNFLGVHGDYQNSRILILTTKAHCCLWLFDYIMLERLQNGCCIPTTFKIKVLVDRLESG